MKDNLGIKAQETHFGGGGDGPRLTVNLNSLSLSLDLDLSLSPENPYSPRLRRLSLRLDREGNCASAAWTLNCIDFLRGLRARGSSKEIPLGLCVELKPEPESLFRLPLDVGRSSDSKEGFGDGGADMLLSDPGGWELG